MNDSHMSISVSWDTRKQCQLDVSKGYYDCRHSPILQL